MFVAQAICSILMLKQMTEQSMLVRYKFFSAFRHNIKNAKKNSSVAKEKLNSLSSGCDVKSEILVERGNLPKAPEE